MWLNSLLARATAVHHLGCHSPWTLRMPANLFGWALSYMCLVPAALPSAYQVPYCMCRYLCLIVAEGTVTACRDLSKPIGALNPKRLATFRERFQELQARCVQSTLRIAAHVACPLLHNEPPPICFNAHIHQHAYPGACRVQAPLGNRHSVSLTNQGLGMCTNDPPACSINTVMLAASA